ncbi:o-succinylbenzoate synthase [Acrocarpospora catenulata]|uniref:o-succinylbenzoate synthase n=1 Tax=Acrocarpospora catenulata TaxID=2836182 RepID=UPI001BD97E72|nr:o-succinylbenzoate synthase [Acrocarpospora catenulata]
MRPDRVVLRMVTAKLSRPFENRWQSFETWTKVLVRADADGLSGYGECTAMETPYYNYETIETAWHLLARYLAPLVLDGRDMSVVSGHEEAKGALECALWDLRARLAGRPLCVEIGGAVRPVEAAATVGIEPSPEELVAAVGAARDAGYHRVRVKIRPGWDLVPVRAVRAAFPGLPLIADANAAYGPGDLDHLTGLDGLGLLAIEQPFGAGMIDESAALRRRLTDTTVCLDESVKSAADARRALRAGACGIVNIKIGRVGGLAEAIRIHDLCRDHGVPTFVGAKYELGVGRWTNLALATLPGMTLAGDVGPSARYYVDDGAFPTVEFAAPGWVEPLAAPGIGAEPTDGVAVTRELVLTKE